MNKLLQHIIDAGDVDHRVLPGLQKARKQFNAEKNPYLVFAQEGVEYKGPSIVDYLATKGYSGKKQFRKELADKYGIEGYDFSAAKNTELLNRLRESDELLRQYDQTMAPIPVERMMEMEQQARAARQAAAAQPNTQPVRRPAPVYNFSPEFQNMRIPEIKVNTSLQPKVIYDGKFSLKPKMVIPMPFGFNKTTPAPEVPNSEITDPVRNTPARPKLNLPQYNPFVRPEVRPELGPFISDRYNDVQEVDPLTEQGAPEFLFNSEKLFNSFNRPKQKPLLPVVIPAKKPVVKTEKYTKPEAEELPWYEEAANAVTSTLKGFYNDFAEAVEKSSLDFGQMNFGTPMSPQGAKEMTRDFTKRGLSLFSPDMAEKYDNWLNRQQAIQNMDKDPVSKIVVPDFDYAPMYITGDTIPDSERQYHLAESMDLNALKFGVRNRGDLSPLDTEAASITAFHPFVDAKLYFTQIADDPANATYLGITPDGQVQVGGRKDVENKDVKITRVFSNKVVDFVRDPTGGIKKVPAGAKVNKNAFSPAVTVIGDDGKQKEGKLNLVVPQGTKADDAFGVATGGRFIFQTPDGQSRLVSGSLNNIEQEFKRIKGNNPYVTVISLDNGSFSRGLRTRDKRLTATDLRSYDNLNTGGGNFAYLLPNQQTSRPLAKFDEFEKEATKRLQALYPGKKVSVEYQDTGDYNQVGGRDIQTQADIQKKGNSQTPVSLHNFNAARDYVLYVDGKPINGNEKNKVGNDIYKEVLWKAADKTGVYHIDPWDVGHIGLAKEGQKTAFDELKSKYPEIFTDPNFVKSLEFINKNKNNPNYQEYYELLNNIQKFTGAPRTTEFMKQKSTAKKAYGGPVDLPKAQWGQLINPITMGAFSTMALKLRDFLGLDEPKIVRTPASAPKRLSIRDPRKVMMTSGKPLRPNSDLVSGEYDSEDLGNLLTEAKRRKMSYNDMMNLAAMGFQETKWGQTDPNIGHTQDIFGDDPNPDAYENFINAYNAKMKDADRLKIKDEATRLQVYNGLGKVFPSTEADYHGFKMKKIYGVEVPKGGIDLRKNPLYGKQVIDIRDNVLKRNPEFMRYMDSTYRAPMPKEKEFANGGLVKMQRAGQYTAQRDATAVNIPVQSKMFGAQREIDVDRFSEDAFKQKYNMTPHQYKMRTDSNYAQAFERQMDERRQNDPNYSELNLPATDIRSKNYRGNPNLALIPKGATGPARAQQEQLFTDMTSLSAPLLPVKSLVRGLQVGKAASAAPKIIKQLSNPPSSIKITPEGSVNNYDPSWDTDIVWGAYQNRWQDTGGFEPVRDWPITGPGFRNFNSNFYNRTNSIIGNTVRNVDEKLGKLLSTRTNTPTFDPDEVTRLINENLSKGAGVKKENLPLQVRYAPFNNDEDTALRLETLIDNNKVGSIFLQRNMDPYKPKTLSQILLNKVPTPNEAWRNTPGFRKKGDFPFQYYDEFNPVKDPSGKVFNTVNDLYKTGVSGEFNKAINQALKEKGLGNVLSGGTGHSKLGEARWHHLVQKGLAEDLGGGYFKLKKQGGPVILPKMQMAGHNNNLPQRVSINDPRYAELYKNRQVGSYYDGAYSLPDLPEVTVTGKDERIKEGMSKGSSEFYKGLAGVMSAPQVVTMDLLTGKQQTPSQAWGFDTKDKSWYHPKSVSNFAMDTVLDPMNALGVGLIDDVTRGAVRLGAKQAARRSANYLTTKTPLKNTYKYNPLALKDKDVEILQRWDFDNQRNVSLPSGVVPDEYTGRWYGSNWDNENLQKVSTSVPNYMQIRPGSGQIKTAVVRKGSADLPEEMTKPGYRSFYSQPATERILPKDATFTSKRVDVNPFDSVNDAVDYDPTEFGNAWSDARNLANEALPKPNWLTGYNSNVNRNVTNEILDNASNYLTTRTPLGNAYKYNPYAFKPNSKSYYRGLGRSGVDDALEKGILRPPVNTPYGKDRLYMTETLGETDMYNQDLPTYKGDPFGEADDEWIKILPKDGKRYIAEIPKNKTNFVIENDIFNSGSGYSTIFPKLSDVKLYQQDWLRGYKPIKLPNKKSGGPILDPRGQWAHPGKVTRIPGSDITMQGVPYPVYGVGSNGQEQMMYPGQEYNFGGASYVDEYPIMQKGGWSGGGLSRFNLETMAGLKNVDYKKKYAHDYDTKKTVEDVSVKEGYKDMRNFMDYWLTERAKDPKFTEWANKRLSVLNNLSGKYKTFTNKDIETGKAPYNALAFYNPEDSSLNFNTDHSSTYSAPVQLHELSHKMDYEDSTFYEKPRYFWDSNDYATPSNFISKQVIPKNKSFTNDRYAGSEDEYSYLSRPTEINARLNEFRYHYNLDPKKKYTAEDMKKIINDHNKYNESFKGATDYHYKSKQNYFQSLYELLKIIGNDPQKLADLHNNVVKNKTSYSSDDIPQAKNGGYTVTRSSDRKGKTHKVTGPDGTVKYFGDSKLGQHPKDPERKAAFYARHKKNLAGNPFFRAFARKTWQGGGQTDSTLENILEVFDPTGLSSWDDVYRSANDPSSKWYDTAIEVAGALPLVGKVGKLAKAGIHLKKYKGLEKAAFNMIPKSTSLSNTLQGVALLGRGSDAIQAGVAAPKAPFFPSAPPAGVGQFGVYAGMPVFEKKKYGGTIKAGKQPLEKKHGIKVTYKK